MQKKIYYSYIEDFPIPKDTALNLGFLVENGMIVIPTGTRFKIIEKVDLGGWPVIEVFGEELDFASEEPILVDLN